MRTSASMSSSSATPMSSSPSATLTPAATSRRSGATPAARRAFEEGLWTTVEPARASSSTSESRSQTPWASALRSPSTPAATSRSSSRPPAKPSPQARWIRLSSECRWIPAPSSAAADPIASTSPSLAHCGAMTANWALSSGSLASSPTSARMIATYSSLEKAGCASPRALPQLRRQRGDEGLVAVVGQARAVAHVRRERDPLARVAMGAQRLLQVARVGLRGRPSPPPDGKCMCRWDVTPDSSNSTLLASVPR